MKVIGRSNALRRSLNKRFSRSNVMRGLCAAFTNFGAAAASPHLFGFPSFLRCLLDGRRGRAPDEYLGRRHPGLEGINRCTSTRVHSVRTHSAFDRDLSPLQRSSLCRYCASVVWFCRLHCPIGRQSKAPATPPVQFNFTHA